jgi:uncharacterized surface anchored protein
VEYYIQDYLISTNKYLQSYDISIKDFPEGTIILNSNNDKISNSNSKNIRIAVPINNIKEDVNGTIFIQNALIKTNPIYYCESIEEGAQSYVTYNNRYEIAKAEIDLNIKVNTANLLIKKFDEDTGLPLSSVKFEILDINKNKIAEVITDKNGEAIIEGMYPQKVYVKEIEAPKGYIINLKEKEVELEFNKTKEIEFTNETEKGQIKIIKIDKDNKEIKLSGVEFEVLDENDRILEKIVTDEKGEAISKEYALKDYQKLKIREVKSLDNYILNNEIKIVLLKKDEISNVVFENEKKKEPEPEAELPKLPRTGH